MPQRIFGLGSLMTIPSGANPTPNQFAILKDFSVDLSADLEELRGEKVYAIDAAKKNGKLGGSIKFAQFSPDSILMAAPGAVATAGGLVGVRDEAATIPATPYQVTVANGANFDVDLGVVDLTTGKQMTRVAAAPAAGQYSLNVATGQYTFAAADTTHQVAISYTYKTPAAGKTVTISNQVMTTSTPYEMRGFNSTGGKPFAIRLPAIHIPKCSFGLKSEGWAEHGLDYTAVADQFGNVAYLYFAE